MKKSIGLLLALCLLLPLVSSGEGTEISVTAPAGVVHPWEAILIRYTLPEDCKVDLTLLDDTGDECFVVAREVYSHAGQNSLYWNGTFHHQAAPAGTWRLYLETGKLSAESLITIGEPIVQETATPVPEPAPEAERPEKSDPEAEPSDPPAEPDPTPDLFSMDTSPVEVSEKEEAAQKKTAFTPSTTSPYAGKDQTLNYWTMPMDIQDEETVWQVLMAPITVVGVGLGEKAQITLRSEPSLESSGVGVVTCETQGVHVLERGEEWSLIECYSSSFHDSKILNWNALVQGYIQTKYLNEIQPNQEMGMVVDKLTQRLYIFREGHLYSTLLVSTGISNARQPYNETRSGEFLLTSKVGEFSSDNLYCPLAIRFNGGDLLHGVPYTKNQDESKNYTRTESKLGTKASHGCIRVQRKATPEGVNMQWIWNKLKANSRTKLLIWEDWQGRQIEIPSDDTLLYYNPKGGQYYHSKETCNSTRYGLVFESFYYSQLEEGRFAKLKRCDQCAPLLRKSEIEAINQIYAPGGDHDPVLTEARQTCPRPLK